jgi:hypothetical protein
VASEAGIVLAPSIAPNTAVDPGTAVTVSLGMFTVDHR